MPIDVFGIYSNNCEHKIDTKLFVQKPYLKTNYIHSNIEEDIDLKNEYRNKNLSDPISIREACGKNYIANLFNNPSILKNTAHIDLTDRNITNARFIQVNQQLQIDSNITAKLYADKALDEMLLVRNSPDNDFSNKNLTNINSITLNTQAVKDSQVLTKAYVDQFLQKNERSRRDLGIDFHDEASDLVKNNQDNDFNGNKLTNLDSVIVNRNPISDNEVTNKKYIDDPIGQDTIVRFNQTLQNCLKVSVGNNTYNPAKYDKIHISDTTILKAPNSGGYWLQSWNINRNDKINNSKIGILMKSTKTSSPTSESGATRLPPIGNRFMCIETSSNNHGNNVFCQFRTNRYY